MGVYHYSRFSLLLACVGIAHASFEEIDREENIASAAEQRALADDSKEASSLDESTSGKNDKGDTPMARKQSASAVAQDAAIEQLSQSNEELPTATARTRNPKALIRTHIIGDRVVSDAGELDDATKSTNEDQILVQIEGDRAIRLPNDKHHDAMLASFMRRSRGADQESVPVPSQAELPILAKSKDVADDVVPESHIVVGSNGETNTGLDGTDSHGQSSFASPDESPQLGSTDEDSSLPDDDNAATMIDTMEDDGSTPVVSQEPETRISCCDHRRRRQVVSNKCTISKRGNGERWWCDKDFPSAGVCGCFGGEGTGHKAECAWCGKDVFHGEPGDQDCKFVNKKMTMSGCDKDASSIKEIAPWFSGWGEYILCENGLVAGGKNATCHISGGHMTGYHQRWYTDDCNFVYIFYYHDNQNVHNAFSVLTHLDREQRFKHEHWLQSTYIECDAKSSTCAGSY